MRNPQKDLGTLLFEFSISIGLTAQTAEDEAELQRLELTVVPPGSLANLFSPQTYVTVILRCKQLVFYHRLRLEVGYSFSFRLILSSNSGILNLHPEGGVFITFCSFVMKEDYAKWTQMICAKFCERVGLSEE